MMMVVEFFTEVVHTFTKSGTCMHSAIYFSNNIKLSVVVGWFFVFS